MMQRIGFGYDVHRLVAGRKLVLGGIEIPYGKGLSGHSDADVLLHAVCDAMLGALGKGDIGEHFPDTDQKYKDVSSLKLLEEVAVMVKDEGFAVNNVDAVVLAEEPKLGDYKLQIKSGIALKIGCDPSAVNVKATTTEGLGFVGNKEGMAAYAVVMLSKKGR